MALFKILKGNSSDLGKSTSTNSATTHEGWCYFTPDTGCFYIDIDNNESPILGTNRIQLNAGTAYNNVYNITASTTNGALVYTTPQIPGGSTPVENTVTVYTHPTTAGNKHIPAGGSTGNWLRFSSDGTATWASITWDDVGGKPNQATRWPTWDEVTGKPTAFTPSSHTHATSIAADTAGTNQLSLAANTQYKLTAGGTNFIFKTPPNVDISTCVKTTGNWSLSGVISFTNTTASTSTSTGAVKLSGGLGVAGHIYAAAVHNAVWNDYAECRKADCEEPGRVIAPSNSGIAHKTTERLMPGCRIISDTWGHIIGESTEANTPIAVSGRVLVYPYRDRKEYHIGDCVCSAPNGTADIMTREEIEKWPDRIIGIVNEIPDYEIWEQIERDNKEHIIKVKIKERIWVDVK